MKRWSIWRIAAAARDQICLHPARPSVEIAALAGRTRDVEINGVALSLEWEMDGRVNDDEGVEVLGATEVACTSIAAATIRLNADLIGDRTDLARSTALHELGHVIFDVPAWLTGRVDADDRGAGAREGQRIFRANRADQVSDERDWSEWRANEFMGGFLVPRPLLIKSVAKVAKQLRLSMIEAEARFAPPQLVIDRYSDRFEDLTQTLADIFGVSSVFMATRLIKYQMIAEAR